MVVLLRFRLAGSTTTAIPALVRTGRASSVPVRAMIFRVIADVAIRCIDQPHSSARRAVSTSARSPAQSMKETADKSSSSRG